MKTSIYSLVIIGSLVAFAGCSDRASDQASQIRENAEQRAEAVVENAEQRADSIEESTEQRTATLEEKAENVEQSASDRVDSVQASAEKKADAIEKRADQRADAVEERTENRSASADRLKDRSSVKEAQKKLKEMGYLDGQADGVMGKNTHSAIRDFQKAKGLETTGVLDDRTMDHLNDAEIKAE